MTAYLLVKAIDGYTPNGLGTYNLGFPVVVLEKDQYGGKQVMPKFVQFVIVDADRSEVEPYIATWDRELDWTIDTDNSDEVTDTWQVNAFCTKVSTSGLNALTREQVESFLNQWGASVDSVAVNSVVFTAVISNVIQSEGFWGIVDVSAIVFNENTGNYVPANGSHEITADCNALPSGFTAERIAAAIIRRGGIPIDADGRTITFTITRSAVFSQFKWEVGARVRGVYAVRQWRLSASAVAAAVAAGGSLEVTKAQAIAYLHNRLED